MKKLRPLIFIFLFSLFVSISFAQTNYKEECQKAGITDTNECINYLERQKAASQQQARTLSSQIAVMDSQINLAQARIDATKQQISELSLDIDTANKKIVNLERSLDSLIKAFINRTVATYEIGRADPFEILISSNDVSSFFSRLNYLRIVRQHDKQWAILTQQAKNDYTNQKNIFEDKKKKVVALKTQLENYTNQLEQNKKDKQSLLAVTQSEDAKYQQLLSQAQAERAIVFGGGVDSFLRDVNQGDSIGFIASYSTSPGCSSGAHLHFEVQKDGAVQDPNNYLKGGNYSYDYGSEQYSYYGTINPYGDFPWPLNEPVIIHQGYGSHGFAQNFYPSGIHTGIDMDSSSSTVKAVKSGKLYGGSYNCTNGKLYYAKVVHDGGLVTWYLHTAPN